MPDRAMRRQVLRGEKWGSNLWVWARERYVQRSMADTRRDLVMVRPGKISKLNLQTIGGLVLGCIEAEFCK